MELSINRNYGNKLPLKSKINNITKNKEKI